MAAGASGIRAGRAYVELGADLTKLESSLRRAQQKVAAFGQGIQSAGSGLAKLGVGIGVPLALGAAAFANFEQAMARVKALTGATEPEFAALNAEAKRLGLDTVFSARQAAETMGVFATAGVDATNIIRAMVPTLSLAAAGQIELAMAADVGLATMKSMEYEAKDLTMLLDVLGKASITSATNFQQLGEAFAAVGSVSKFTGVSFQETTAALQVISDRKIQGEAAGNALKAILMSLVSPSVEAQAAIKRLGVEVSDSKNNFRGILPILKDFEKGLASLGTTERAKLITDIFGRRGAPAFGGLLSEGSESLQKKLAALGDAGGVMDKMAATQLDTLKGTFTLLMSSIEGLAISIGGTLSPVLRGIGEGMTLVLNIASRWADQNPLLFRTLSLVSVGAVALGSSLIVLGGIIKVSAVAIGGLVIPLTLLKTSLALTTAMVVGLEAALLALASPIGVVVGLTVGAGVALATYSFQGGNAIANLKTNFLSLADTATATFVGIREAIGMNDLGLALDVAGAGMGVAWAKVMGSIRQGWDWGVNWLTRGMAELRSVFDGLATGLADIWDGLMTMMMGTWNRVITFLRTKWETNKFWKSDEKIQAAVSEIEAGAEAKAQELAAGRAERSKARWGANERFTGAYRDNAQAEIDARNKATAEANAANVGEAQSRLDAILGKVGAKKDLREYLEGGKQLGQGLFDYFLPGKSRGVPTLEGVAASLGKGETQGTFNASAALGLGGKSAMDRMADGIGKATDLLKNIDQNTREQGRAV